MHFDAAWRGVVARLVEERRGIEVRAELAVDAREQVSVERGGDAERIVVGCDQLC